MKSSKVQLVAKVMSQFEKIEHRHSCSNSHCSQYWRSTTCRWAM